MLRLWCWMAPVISWIHWTPPCAFFKLLWQLRSLPMFCLSQAGAKTAKGKNSVREMHLSHSALSDEGGAQPPEMTDAKRHDPDHAGPGGECSACAKSNMVVCGAYP